MQRILKSYMRVKLTLSASKVGFINYSKSNKKLIKYIIITVIYQLRKSVNCQCIFSKTHY